MGQAYLRRIRREREHERDVRERPMRSGSFPASVPSLAGAVEVLLSQGPVQHVAEADPRSPEPGPNDGHVLFQIG